MISISTPFSASTIRVLWLLGSSGEENRVMIERRLDTEWLSLGGSRPGAPVRSAHHFPVLFLQQPDEYREHRHEQHDPDSLCVPLNLRRLARVVEEIYDIAHEPVVLGGVELARHQDLEMVHRLLLLGGRPGG